MKHTWLLVLSALFCMGSADASLKEDAQWYCRKGGKKAHHTLVDWRTKNDDGEKQHSLFAPDADLAGDMAGFFLFHSKSPAAIRAAHASRSALKVGHALGSMRKTGELLDIKDKGTTMNLGRGAQTLTTGANIYHAAVHDIPDSLRTIKHAPALGARNGNRSAFTQAQFDTEKKWQIALGALRYLAAIPERMDMNMQRDDRASDDEKQWALVGRGWLGSLRNLLRLWQQSRQSRYYRQQLDYTLHPEKEQAAMQAQLDEKERRRLVWQQRRAKLGKVFGDMWHTVRDKGIDPLVTFGKREWKHLSSLVKKLTESAEPVE